MPVLWPNEEAFLEKQRAIFEALEITEGIPSIATPLPDSYFPQRIQNSYVRTDANSVPKNYCYGASTASFDVAYPSYSIFNSSAISSCYNDRSSHIISKKYSSENEATSSRSSYRKLSSPSVRRNQTCTGFFLTFPDIPSVESDTYEPETYQSKNLKKWSSADSTNELIDFQSKPCELSQGYFNSNLENKLLNRQHSLVADDQIIDVEYDSDVGWQTKSVRKNPYKKNHENSENLNRERRDSLKLNLNNESSEISNNKTLERKNSVTVQVKPKLHSSPKRQPQDLSTLKKQLEGTVVSPKMNDELIKQKYVSEKAVGYEKNSKLSDKKNPFVKCRSTISATSDNSNESLQYDGDIADDVFDASIHSKNVTPKKKPQRRSNSFEALPPKKPHELKSRNSFISIKENPEYFEATKPNNIASPLTTAKPSRGSLKKSSTKCSDYDRDRGRSRHMESGHRESFKKNDRTNERGSEQDSSDRELKGGSLNRSLSNTDTNLEDRIGL